MSNLLTQTAPQTLKRPISKKVGCSAFTHLMWVVIFLGGNHRYITNITIINYTQQKYGVCEVTLPLFSRDLALENNLPYGLYYQWTQIPWFIIMFYHCSMFYPSVSHGLSSFSPCRAGPPFDWHSEVMCFAPGLAKGHRGYLWNHAMASKRPAVSGDVFTIQSGFSEFGSGIRLKFYQRITHDGS